MRLLALVFPHTTPAEIERRERERIARKKPHLALAAAAEDPRPDPGMFAWHDVGDLIARARR